MTKSASLVAGIAIGAALLAGASNASATTVLLKDSGLGATDILNTTGELTGGDSSVAASAAGVFFEDKGFFTIAPGELLTSFNITTQGTSKIGEITYGVGEIFTAGGAAITDSVTDIAVVPLGVLTSVTSFSPEFLLGPGSYYIDIQSFGIDAVSTQHLAKYSVELQGAAVPEPATWAVMLTGFGAMGAYMRRKRAVAAA